MPVGRKSTGGIAPQKRKARWIWAVTTKESLKEIILEGARAHYKYRLMTEKCDKALGQVAASPVEETAWATVVRGLSDEYKRKWSSRFGGGQYD